MSGNDKSMDNSMEFVIFPPPPLQGLGAGEGANESLVETHAHMPVPDGNAKTILEHPRKKQYTRVKLKIHNQDEVLTNAKPSTKSSVTQKCSVRLIKRENRSVRIEPHHCGGRKSDHRCDTARRTVEIDLFTDGIWTGMWNVQPTKESGISKQSLAISNTIHILLKEAENTQPVVCVSVPLAGKHSQKVMQNAVVGSAEKYTRYTVVFKFHKLL